MNALSIPDTLIHVMVSVSAVDSDMTDLELNRIGALVRELPVFAKTSADQLVNASKVCRDILQEDEGLQTVLGLAAGLPHRFHTTAYALACEVAAADENVAAEEMRFLQLLRGALGLDKLTAAAIELSAHARHQRLGDDA